MKKKKFEIANKSYKNILIYQYFITFPGFIMKTCSACIPEGYLFP